MTSLTVGQQWETQGLTVTETHVVNWSGLTGDWVTLHTDAEAAAASVFGERVAHGPLTLALALGLVTQLRIFDGRVVAWLGLQDVRASAPVKLGDTIRVRVCVESLRPSREVTREVAALDYSVVNQRDDEVMSFTNKLLLLSPVAAESVC